MTVYEMPVQYLTVQEVSVQDDTWQSTTFCWSRIWQLRKCLDIRFAIDLQGFESQVRSPTNTTRQLESSTTDTSQQFNIIILYITQSLHILHRTHYTFRPWRKTLPAPPLHCTPNYSLPTHCIPTYSVITTHTFLFFCCFYF